MRPAYLSIANLTLRAMVATDADEAMSWFPSPFPVGAGQGFGTEAKMLLLEYAFDRIHLHVVQSWVRSSNTRSAAALVKQGYRPSGRRYWKGFQAGDYVDHLIFDLLRDEWFAARAEWRLHAATRTADPDR